MRLPDGDWKHVFPNERPDIAPDHRIAVCSVVHAGFLASPSRAQEYTAQEIVESGHRFFGATSGGLASVVEHIFASYGLPNGYVLGEEGSGAFVGGLTYGEGTLYTKNAGDHKVFWQGPSLGWDFGGQGSRTMMLVYNLDEVPNSTTASPASQARPMSWPASASPC